SQGGWITRTSTPNARRHREVEEFCLRNCCRPQQGPEPLTAPLLGSVAMRVLLVEDDPMIGESIRQGLRQDGIAVDWIQDGEAAELAVRTTAYALVLLDLGLPRKSGLEVLTTLRRTGHAIPVLILTARDAVADRVRGLDSGADDYLVKPFALAEMCARLRALIRRAAGQADPVLVVGDVAIDPRARAVTRGGVPVPLTAREYALVELLA